MDTVCPVFPDGNLACDPLSNDIRPCCSLGANVAVAPAGETTSALYNASEALRLGSTLFSLLAPERAAAPSDVGQPSAASSSSSESQDISADHAGQGQNPPQSQKTSEASLGGGTDHMQSAVGPDGMKNNAAGPGITQGPMSGEVGLEGVGYWQVTWLYLTSLLKLGEVYELAGSHEDALHAFKEGQELVSAW